MNRLKRSELLAKQDAHTTFIRKRYDDIQGMKSPRVAAALSELRETTPEVWQWVQTLEMLNTSIWCNKCLESCTENSMEEYPPPRGGPKKSIYSWAN